MIKSIVCFFIGITLLSTSCSDPEKYTHQDKSIWDGFSKRKKDSLIYELEKKKINFQDTLRYSSMIFLLQNMKDKDRGSVAVSYLIQNVDLAILQAGMQIKEGTLSFADFCEYVLPYQLSAEPLSDWRNKAIYDFSNTISNKYSKTDTNGIFSICKDVNKQMGKDFVFKSDAQPADKLTWEQMVDQREGDCLTMASLVVFPLRAMGLPTAIDITPYWANTNGGHAWNVVLVKGESIPFLGCEGNPPYPPFNNFKSHRWPGKIFRRVFSVNRESLAVSNTFGEVLPEHLADPYLADVTDQYRKYFKSYTIQLRTTEKIDRRFAYLAVYNSGEWRIVFGSKVTRGLLSFPKMASGVVYLPCLLMPDKSLKLFTDPVLLDSLGNTRNLRADYSTRINMVVKTICSIGEAENMVYKSKAPRLGFEEAMEKVSAEGYLQTPDADSLYALYYWDKKWILSGTAKRGTAKTQSGKLVFTNVPSGALYRICSKNQAALDGRIFTYTDRKQEWY